MRITIQRHQLLGPLSQVVKAAPSKTTIPILEGVLIDVDQSLRLTCSDSEITISTAIREYTKVEGGSTVVPAKKLLEIVKKIPEKELTIEANDTAATIKCGTTKIKLPVQAADEYPAMSQISANPIKIDGQQFVNMVDSVAYAVSKRADGSHVLMGICLNVNQDQIEAVATDRCRLSRYCIKTVGPISSSRVVVPVKAMDIVAKLKMDAIDVFYTPSEIHFQVGSYVIRSKLIAGTYPDTSKIIPTDHNTMVVIDRDDFLNALDLADEVIESDKKMIYLDISDNVVRITAKDDAGEMEESLDAAVEGDDITLCVNVRFLIDALKTIQLEKVVMRMIGPTSPVMICGKDDPHTTALILPIRTG